MATGVNASLTVSLIALLVAIVAVGIALDAHARLRRYIDASVVRPRSHAIAAERYRIVNAETHAVLYAGDDGVKAKAVWALAQRGQEPGRWQLWDRGVHRGTIYRPVMSGS